MRRSLRAWREKLVQAAQEMAAQGLATGSSGNLSCRIGDLVLITPSGVPYRWLRPHQVVAIDLAGRWVPRAPAPSSEWRMHVSIYRAREDVLAIVHTHSPYATTASLGPRLGVLHDEGKLLFGEEVPVSRPAPPGSWALAEAVVQALGSGKVALIGRHGAVAVGSTLREALLLAVKLEEAAQLAFLAGAMARPSGGNSGSTHP
jgi:L-fuculose-phosphate aldolase